jgi:hypothetical protein
VIVWPGDQMHEAVQKWMRDIQREFVPERDRCVNCDERATDNGWCCACWAEIIPSVPAPAATEPFDTGCGRR